MMLIKFLVHFFYLDLKFFLNRRFFLSEAALGSGAVLTKGKSARRRRRIHNPFLSGARLPEVNQTR